MLHVVSIQVHITVYACDPGHITIYTSMYSNLYFYSHLVKSSLCTAHMPSVLNVFWYACMTSFGCQSYVGTYLGGSVFA